MLVLLIRLGAIVAQSDGTVSQAEIDVLREMIRERKVLSDAQRTSLQLWLHWCTHTPQHIEDIAPSLSDIDDKLRNHISQVLIKVALANGELDDREHDNLVALHRALGLPAIWVDLGITEARGGLVIPEVQKNSTKTEHEDSNFQTHGVEIPNNLTQALSQIHENTPIPSTKNEENSSNLKESLTPSKKLDRAHLKFLEGLLAQPQWERLQVFKIAMGLDLMADRAMNRLNDVCRERYGSDIIRDGDTVTIDTKQATTLYRDLQ